MLTTLRDFLPPSPAGPVSNSVAVVRVQERQIGLGRLHSLEEREFFPVVHKGVRLSGAVRFQLWNEAPDALEAQLRGLTENVLGERDTLEAKGFVQLSLSGVSTTEHLGAIGSWRQTAEFDVLYEFRKETSDLAGGLIAKVPVELRDEWGALLVTGDLAVWDEHGAPSLVLVGPRPVAGLGALAFVPLPPPAGAVTVTRTFEGASGPPVEFASLDNFLDAVAGSSPASRHGRVTLASLELLLTALGPPGEPVTLVDEAGHPRSFAVTSRTFAPPVVLRSPSDRLEVAFAAPSLASGQVLYLRASRGGTNSP